MQVKDILEALKDKDPEAMVFIVKFSNPNSMGRVIADVEEVESGTYIPDPKKEWGKFDQDTPGSIAPVPEGAERAIGLCFYP